MYDVPFNHPHTVGTEMGYIGEAVAASHLSANGAFSKRCTTWIEQEVGCSRALLTHTCTAALEMAALLCDIDPGDEASCRRTRSSRRRARSRCGARRRVR